MDQEKAQLYECVLQAWPGDRAGKLVMVEEWVLVGYLTMLGEPDIEHVLAAILSGNQQANITAEMVFPLPLPEGAARMTVNFLPWMNN